MSVAREGVYGPTSLQRTVANAVPWTTLETTQGEDENAIALSTKSGLRVDIVLSWVFCSWALIHNSHAGAFYMLCNLTLGLDMHVRLQNGACVGTSCMECMARARGARCAIAVPYPQSA